MEIRTGIGQDSHAFADKNKPLMLGGVHFEGEPGLNGNSDADVVLHALCNAISGISGKNVLGEVTDALCADGITDSREYVGKALDTLGAWKVTHLSVSIEGRRPKISPFLGAMKASISDLLEIEPDAVGITATSGEGLTSFGKGEGIQAMVIVTAVKE